MSAAACNTRLACDDPFAVLRESTLSQEGLEHGSLRLLELKEQRVAVVPAQQKQNPGPSADAPDADDLPRGVNVAVAFEKFPPIRWSDSAYVEIIRRMTALSCASSAAGNTSSIGVISGGLPTIRSSPSTARQRRPARCPSFAPWPDRPPSDALP